MNLMYNYRLNQLDRLNEQLNNSYKEYIHKLIKNNIITKDNAKNEELKKSLIHDFILKEQLTICMIVDLECKIAGMSRHSYQHYELMVSNMTSEIFIPIYNKIINSKVINEPQ